MYLLFDTPDNMSRTKRKEKTLGFLRTFQNSFYIVICNFLPFLWGGGGGMRVVLLVLLVRLFFFFKLLPT